MQVFGNDVIEVVVYVCLYLVGVNYLVGIKIVIIHVYSKYK